MGVEGAALLPLGGPGKGVVGTLLLLRHRGIGLPLLHPPPRPPPAFPTLGLLLPPLIPAFTPIIHCCFARHVPHVAERRCGAVRCFPAGQDGCVGGVAAGVPSSPPRSHARLIHPNHTRTTASSSLVTRRWCGVVFAGVSGQPKSRPSSPCGKAGPGWPENPGPGPGKKIPAQLPLWQGRPLVANPAQLLLLRLWRLACSLSLLRLLPPLPEQQKKQQQQHRCLFTPLLPPAPPPPPF